MNAYRRRRSGRAFLARVLGLRTLAALCAALLAAAGARAQTPATGQAVRLTLKQAVALATQKSREVALANLRYDLAKRQQDVPRAAFLPNLYAGSGAAFTYGSPLFAGGGTPSLFTLSYDETLFDPLTRSDVSVAREQAEQQRLAAQDASNTVTVRAASSYLELAKVRRELDLMRKERDSAQQILDFTKDRAGAGYELPIEVTKAQLTSARIEQRIAQLEDQDDTLSDQLRTLLGYPQDIELDVATEDLPAGADQSANDLEAQALQNNVGIRQAESERRATLDHLKGTKGGYWPTIGVIAQYNLLAKYNDYDLFFKRFQANNVIAGVDIKIPVFASRTAAAIRYARANVNAAETALENKRGEVSVDVRHKARVVKEADTTRQVAQLELNLAQQNLQVLQAQFQQGRASVRDMETAQLDENDKWLAFLDADFARQQAQLDLLQTTGQVATLFQ